jgi:hypothetical protein
MTDGLSSAAAALAVLDAAGHVGAYHSARTMLL